MMPGKSVIIIGAGIAGLSAGIYARMNGYGSRIFEHHSKPGGVVAAWRRNDYLIDGGVHFMMGYKPGQATYEIYRELGIFDYNTFRDLHTYMSIIDENSGRSIEITWDLEKFRQNLKAFSPSDSKEIDSLVNAARRMRGMDMMLGMDRPHELMSRLDHLKAMWKARRVMRFFAGKYRMQAAQYAKTFRDPWVGDIIANLFFPTMPLGMVIMILASLADGQIGIFEGGSLDFARGLEKRYLSFGGEINYKATVKKILVENGAAVGVMLADGSEHRADAVVSAADGYSTVNDMLDGRYVDKKTGHRFNNWRLIRPLLMASFGVQREFTGEPYMRLIKLENPIEAAGEKSDWLFIRLFNYNQKFSPSGKTVVQATIETNWDFWHEMQKNDRHKYDEEKAQAAAEFLSRLEKSYPGISDQVEVTDVATPYTTWRYTLNHKGAFEGWLPTPEAIMTRIKKTLPGLKNFYMAGQWVMPGGGVPPCLCSGKHVIQILCKKDGIRFKTSIP